MLDFAFHGCESGGRRDIFPAGCSFPFCFTPLIFPVPEHKCRRIYNDKHFLIL